MKFSGQRGKFMGNFYLAQPQSYESYNLLSCLSTNSIALAQKTCKKQQV